MVEQRGVQQSEDRALPGQIWKSATTQAGAKTTKVGETTHNRNLYILRLWTLLGT